MKSDSLEDATNLERDDLDPERFAAALAVQHIGRLLRYGGGRYGRPGDEDDLRPEHFERFVPRALEHAQKTERFVSHWHRFQRTLPRIRAAWEKGQSLFQEDLARSTGNEEQMDYFSMIDFATDCYAYISAKNTYPENQMLQAWTMNGYMLAWRKHFLSEEESAQE